MRLIGSSGAFDENDRHSDGQPFVLTINGSKAQLSTPETTTGPHTIELVDPAGCFPAQLVNCPAN